MDIRERVLSRLKLFGLFVLGIACASSCISEALARNCTRILVFCLILNFVLSPKSIKKILKFRMVCASIFIWFLVQCVSLMYSGHMVEFLDNNTFTMNYIMLLIIAGTMYIKSSEHAMNLLLIIFASVFVNDIYVFFQTMNGINRPSSLVAPGVIVTTMIYAIALPAMVAVFFYTGLSKFKRLAVAICIIASLAGLICSNTRGAWLVLLPLVFFMFMYYMPDWKKRLLFSLSCIIIGGALLFSFSSVMHRANTIVHGGQENSVTERFRMWHSAYNMGMDYPIFGVGKGNYAELYQTKYISPKATEPTQRHAHNTFIQTFAEMGMIGELAYLSMIVFLVMLGIKNYKNNFGMAFLGATLGLLLYSLTDYTLAVYSAMRLYWLLSGICIAGIYISK